MSLEASHVINSAISCMIVRLVDVHNLCIFTYLFGHQPYSRCLVLHGEMVDCVIWVHMLYRAYFLGDQQGESYLQMWKLNVISEVLPNFECNFGYNASLGANAVIIEVQKQ